MVWHLLSCQQVRLTAVLAAAAVADCTVLTPGCQAISSQFSLLLCA